MQGGRASAWLLPLPHGPQATADSDSRVKLHKLIEVTGSVDVPSRPSRLTYCHLAESMKSRGSQTLTVSYGYVNPDASLCLAKVHFPSRALTFKCTRENAQQPQLSHLHKPDGPSISGKAREKPRRAGPRPKEQHGARDADHPELQAAAFLGLHQLSCERSTPATA